MIVIDRSRTQILAFYFQYKTTSEPYEVEYEMDSV